MAWDIFISYSRKDLDFVTKLHADLIGHGLRAWFDQSSITVGDQWRQTIVQGIKDCQVFLIVLSPDSVQSPNVRKELDLAESHKRGILPVMYRETIIPDTMEYQLAGIHYQSFTADQYGESFDRLITALGKIIKVNGEIIPDPVIADITSFPLEPEIVSIPEGEFLMGSKKEDDVPDYEKPQTKIFVPAFKIGKYLVTNEQYAEFIRQTKQPVRSEMGWQGLIPAENRLKHPVVGISWDDALAYCQWLTEQSNRPGTYTLPSEAEWEKAARGTDGRNYPWGNDWDSECCNYANNDTTPATSPPDWVDPCFPKGVSPYGCYDMVGNVREWTRTLWGKRLVAPDPPYPRLDNDQDHLNAPKSIYRAHRGGAFNDELSQLRCSARGAYNPEQADPRLGFRVVLK